MNRKSPAFQQLSLDNQQFHIDINAAWELIQDSYARLNKRFSEDLLACTFAQWSQLQDHLLTNGKHVVYAHFLRDFQHEIHMTLLKSHEEFSVELMRTVTELNLVNATMLLDFSRRGFDCLEVEEAALSNVLNSKQYLIKTLSRNEIHSLSMLVERYAQEPRPEFVKMILDEVLNDMTGEAELLQFCLLLPIEFYKNDRKGFYSEWLNENQEKLVEKLQHFKSSQLSDTHVLYALRAGASVLAKALYPNIGKLNDYRSAVSLKNKFGEPLADFAWHQFRSGSPKQAMAYIIACPEEFMGTDMADKRYENITLTEHLPDAIKLLSRQKFPVNHDHLSNLIDNYSAPVNVNNIIDKLKSLELVENDFRKTSVRLKRLNLESELSL